MFEQSRTGGRARRVRCTVCERAEIDGVTPWLALMLGGEGTLLFLEQLPLGELPDANGHVIPAYAWRVEALSLGGLQCEA